MKLIYEILFCLLIGIVSAKGQTLVLGTFDDFEGTECLDGQTANPQPFYTSNCDTKGWYAFQGTPHLVTENNNRFIKMWGGSDYTGLHSNPGEALYVDYEFKQGKQYTVSYLVNANDKTVSFYARLANGLTTPPLEHRDSDLYFPHWSDYQNQLVGSHLNLPPDAIWKRLYITFTPNADYAQIAFYAIFPGGLQPSAVTYILFDGATVLDQSVPSSKENSCCPDHALYQNNLVGGGDILPSTTKVDDYIKAGNNVDSSVPVGDVIVQSGRNVTFNAGEEIILKPGFKVNSGATFNAKLQACNLPFTASIIASENFCEITLKAVPCSGYGLYKYSWSGGAGSTQEIKVDPAVTTSYSVTVTDIGNNTQTTAQITVNPSTRFTGGFSVYVPNVMTPNGDGINDKWEVRDGSSSTGPLNAYKYNLTIINRWGIVVFESSGESNAGFYGGDINWNGRINGTGNYCVNGTYNYYLELFNCNYPSGNSYNGYLDILGSPQGSERINFEEVTEIPKKEEVLLIYPNPSNGKIICNYFINQKKSVSISLYDSYGNKLKEVMPMTLRESGTYENSFDFSYLKKGIYYLTVNGMKSPNRFKLIIDK